jgi:ATP-binding cassette subfamily F protein 3
MNIISMVSHFICIPIEPTNFLDMQGIIKLRGLIKTMQDQKTTVVLVSHDVDLINSTATDIVHYANQNLTYYRGM